MLTLAFDTATNVATSALLEDGKLLGERTGLPARLLEDVDDLLTSADAEPDELQRIVVGTGPGSFTSLRMGLAAGRALAFALDVQVAGVSTLEALAAGAPAALPVIDARRREVFTLIDGNPVATPSRPNLVTLCYKDGLASAMGLSGTARCSRRPAPRSRPTTASCTSRARACTRGSPPTSGRPSSSSRSTSGFPTRTGSVRDDRVPKAQAARPGLDRGDRARLVPDAVVAVDVRGRAREAVLDLPRRGRHRSRRARRLPDHLALRRRLARDEHRGCADVQATRDRARHDGAAVRSHRARRQARLHARGARLERLGDPPLRGARLPGPRNPPRLLHGQP